MNPVLVEKTKETAVAHLDTTIQRISINEASEDTHTSGEINEDFANPVTYDCELAIMGFERTFSGLPGEDPAEYIEDVELEAITLYHSEEDMQERLTKSYFRRGLRGEAYKWYRRQSKECRSSWEQLKTVFKEWFCARRIDLDRGIAVRVNSFARRIGESLIDYLKRATKLADECNDEQQKELRSRFINHFLDNGNMADEPMLLRITDRLEMRGLTDYDGFFKSTTSFDQMREVVIQTARTPGKDDNPFYDDADEEIVSMATLEEAMIEIAVAIREVKDNLERHTPLGT